MSTSKSKTKGLRRLVKSPQLSATPESPRSATGTGFGRWIGRDKSRRKRRSSSFNCAGPPSPLSMEEELQTPSDGPMSPTIVTSSVPIRVMTTFPVPPSSRPTLAFRRSSSSSRQTAQPQTFHLNLLAAQPDSTDAKPHKDEGFPFPVRIPEPEAQETSAFDGSPSLCETEDSEPAAILSAVKTERPVVVANRQQSLFATPDHVAPDRPTLDPAQSLFNAADAAAFLGEASAAAPTAERGHKKSASKDMDALLAEFTAACQEIDALSSDRSPGDKSAAVPDEESPSYPFPRMPSISSGGSAPSSRKESTSTAAGTPPHEAGPATTEVAAFPFPGVEATERRPSAPLVPGRSDSLSSVVVIGPDGIQRSASIPELRAAMQAAQTRVAAELRKRRESEQEEAQAKSSPESVDVGRWDRLADLERQQSINLEERLRLSSTASAPTFGEARKPSLFQRFASSLSTVDERLAATTSKSSRAQHSPEASPSVFTQPVAPAQRAAPDFNSFALAPPKIDQSRRPSAFNRAGLKNPFRPTGFRRPSGLSPCETSSPGATFSSPLLTSPAVEPPRPSTFLPSPLTQPSPDKAPASTGSSPRSLFDVLSLYGKTPSPSKVPLRPSPRQAATSTPPLPRAQTSDAVVLSPPRPPAPSFLDSVPRASSSPRVGRTSSHSPFKKRLSKANIEKPAASTVRHSALMSATLAAPQPILRATMTRTPKLGIPEPVPASKTVSVPTFSRGYSNPLGIKMDATPVLPRSGSASSTSTLSSHSRRLSFELPPQPKKSPLDADRRHVKEVAWEEVAEVKRYKPMERPLVEGVVRLPCGRV